MEGAINETLRRSRNVRLHPRMSNALMIYDESERQALADIYREYIAVAQQADVPILVCAPTWRANRERLDEARIRLDVNRDAVHFMQEIRDSYGAWSDNIFVGGLIGCKNDCYQPSEGLETDAARSFHRWQAQKLSDAGADFIMAATLPALPEATGMAHALSETGTPYIISFVINRDGVILDGTGVDRACDTIDAACSHPPLGFMINCAFPSFLKPDTLKRSLFNRLIGYQANASSLDHHELDNSAMLKADDVNEWGDWMLDLHRRFGMKILGGCCGTGREHLQYIVDHLCT